MRDLFEPNRIIVAVIAFVLGALLAACNPSVGGNATSAQETTATAPAAVGPAAGRRMDAGVVLANSGDRLEILPFEPGDPFTVPITLEEFGTSLCVPHARYPDCLTARAQ